MSPKLNFLIQSPYYILGFILLGVVITIMGSFRFVYIGKRAAKLTLYTSLINNFSKIVFLLAVKTKDFVGIVSSILAGVLLSVTVGFRFFIPSVIQDFKYRFSFDWKAIPPIFPYSFGNFLADS